MATQLRMRKVNEVTGLQTIPGHVQGRFHRHRRASASRCWKAAGIPSSPANFSRAACWLAPPPGSSRLPSLEEAEGRRDGAGSGGLGSTFDRPRSAKVAPNRSNGQERWEQQASAPRLHPAGVWETFDPGTSPLQSCHWERGTLSRSCARDRIRYVIDPLGFLVSGSAAVGSMPTPLFRS